MWLAATGSWRVLSNVSGDAGAETGIDMYRADNHFWMFGVGNGAVFHAGPSRQMHWIDTGGNGALRNAGTRADDTFSINGTATMFDVNRIFKAGGAAQYQNEQANGATYMIDLSSGPGSTPAVAASAPLQFARGFHNSVVLPSVAKIVRIRSFFGQINALPASLRQRAANSMRGRVPCRRNASRPRSPWLSLGRDRRGLRAQAQGAQAKPEEAIGACAITSRGNGQKTCMNRVPQAACAANAREQRTEFDWQAWGRVPVN